MVREDRVYFYAVQGSLSSFVPDGDANQTSENAGAGFTECVLTIEEKEELERLKAQYENEINVLKNQIKEKADQKQQIISDNEEKEKRKKALIEQCSVWSNKLAEEKLKLENYTEGTLRYEKQRDVIAYFQDKSDTCLRKSKLNVTEYDTIFITSYCNTNEYEGDITILGDPTWNSDVELLHACGSMGYICPNISESRIEFVDVTKNGNNVEWEVLRKQNGDDITDEECCKKLGGSIISDDSGMEYCNVWNYFYNRS